MADLYSKILEAPPDPNSFNFMQFLGKFGKIICWHPPESWRPLLGDPPLLNAHNEPLIFAIRLGIRPWHHLASSTTGNLFLFLQKILNANIDNFLLILKNSTEHSWLNEMLTPTVIC